MLFDAIPGTPVYVSDGLINVVAPYEIADRASTNVSVIYQQAVSLPIPQAVGAVSPAIYRVTNEDGTKNGPQGSDGEPAPVGSVISACGTGGGQTKPAQRDRLGQSAGGSSVGEFGDGHYRRTRAPLRAI